MRKPQQEKEDRIIYLAELYYKNGRNIKKTLELSTLSPNIVLRTLQKYAKTDLWQETISKLEAENSDEIALDNEKLDNTPVEVEKTQPLTQPEPEARVVLTGVAAVTIQQAAECFNKHILARKKALDAEMVASNKLLSSILSLSDILPAKKEEISQMSVEEITKFIRSLVASYSSIKKSIHQETELVHNFLDLQKIFAENNLIQ